MKKTFFILVATTTFPAFVSAQLNGAYTIGGASPDYATFTAAVSALTGSGVSGPVTFNVRNGTYSEQISIGAVAGVSAVNQVTFQSENLDSTLVTLTFTAPTFTDPYTIKFNGGEHITFRKITIAGMGSQYRRIISFSQGNYNTIENCIVNAPATSCTFGDDYQTSFWGNGALATANYITIQNNVVNNNCCGVMLYYNDNWSILNNTFTGTDFTTINPQNSNYVTIKGNKITNASEYAIWSTYCHIGLVISGNQIVMVSGISIAIYVEGTTATAGGPAIISNNFVKSGNTCISVFFGNYINIYNNSTTGGVGYRVDGNINNVRLVNNIAHTTCSSCGAFTISNTAAVVQSDYNNFYPASGGNIGIWNTTAASTLAAWQSLTSMDANSLNINPQYVSASTADLHICNVSLDGMGLALASVSTDFDNEPRNASTPDIGADEFNMVICGCTAPSTPGSIAGNSTVCLGTNNMYSVTNDPSATSYTWTLPGGWSGTSTTNSINSTTGTGGGTISVTANNACGSSAAQTLNVTVDNVPNQPSSITGNNAVCEGNSQNYSVTNDITATSYTWTLPATWTGTSTSNSISATAGTSSGTISVTANNSCGSSISQTLNVTVNALPTVTLALNANSVCIDNAVFALGGGSPAGGTFSGNGVTSGNFNASTAGVGTHTITYSFTDANSCTNANTDQITVNNCTSISNFEPQISNVVIYPNPGTGMFTVEFSTPLRLTNVQISVLDVLGKILYTIPMTNALMTIDISSTNPGIYLLRIQSENQVVTKQIVKQ